ncbi:MAG: hypothetical protein Q8L27_00525 [archaeon]|nr:hypothetical protein [archaeon]
MPPVKVIIEIPAEITTRLETVGLRERFSAKFKLKDIARQLPSQGVNVEFNESDPVIKCLNISGYNGKFHTEDELRDYVLRYLTENGFTKEGLGL